MTDIEVHAEIELTLNSPSTQHVQGGPQKDMNEVEEPLLLLADVALALPCGDQAVCSSHEIRRVEGSFKFVQLELQLLMNKANELQDCLVNEQGQTEMEALAAEVPRFLYRCQPFFNYLESTASSKMSQYTHQPFDIYTRMLDFSQQLCDKLEQLVLTYASYNLLSLDESEPNSVSHFCIGQNLLGQLRLTTFLYCRPTPYLARVDTGLYKRMRWNVDRFRNEQEAMDEEQVEQSEDTEAEPVGDTEYYFLCCEDMPSAHVESDSNSQGDSCGSTARMWSIGQWVQEIPDPNTKDIYDWIICKVPQGKYHRLLLLGSDEPSSSCATDLLQELLLSQQTTE